MPEIMNVTNPVPGYDNAAGNRSIPITVNDPNVQNIPTPSRVVRPDSNTGEQQNAANKNPAFAAQSTRYDSNFYTFFQRLSEVSLPSSDFTQMIASAFRTVVSSGLKAGTAKDFSSALQMLQMSGQEFTSFLASQISAGSRFNGPLFALLRNAYQQTDSAGVQNSILQFIKQYSDWSSTGHIQWNILCNLNQIAASMPKSWGKEVVNMTALLQNLFAANDRVGSLSLLQSKILPYLSNYVASSHDMGLMRKTLTQLMLNISRYEDGSQEALLDAFHRLTSITSLRTALEGANDEKLLALLKNTPFQDAAKNDWFANQLADAAGRALHGSMGVDTQEAFRSLVSSILVNNSVYMPLNHYLLPIEWNGRMVFSELWVDPDAGEKNSTPSSENTESNFSMKLLLKMDIQTVGLLDVVVACHNRLINLEVFCPASIVSYSNMIQNALSKILEDNKLNVGTVQVEERTHTIAISDVFPKIFERKDSINVTV